MAVQPRKTKNGWQARYRHPDDAPNTYRSAGVFRLKGDAATAAHEQEARIRRGEFVDPKDGQESFASYADRFLDESEYGEESSRARDRSLFENHLRHAFGSKSLKGISTQDIRTWHANLELAPATVSLLRQLLSRVFEQATEDRKVARNPVRLNRKTTRARGKGSKKADRWLTRDELERLADAIEPRFRAAILTQGYMGLRAGELWGLTNDSVNLLKGTLTVLHSLQEDRGYLRLKSTKTEQSERVLPLPKFLVEELRAHMKEFGSEPTLVNTDDGERKVSFVFTGESGKPLRKSWVARKFRPAAVAANLYDGTLRPHALRHGCASMLIAKGANVVEVSNWLGHSNPTVTLNVYSHLFPGRLSDVAAKLDSIHDEELPDNVRAIR